MQLLKTYAEDPDPIVAHSCVVALDMLEFEKVGTHECSGIQSISLSSQSASIINYYPCAHHHFIHCYNLQSGAFQYCSMGESEGVSVGASEGVKCG